MKNERKWILERYKIELFLSILDKNAQKILLKYTEIE